MKIISVPCSSEINVDIALFQYSKLSKIINKTTNLWHMENPFQIDKTEASSMLQVVALPKMKTIPRLLWLKHEKSQHHV